MVRRRTRRSRPTWVARHAGRLVSLIASSKPAAAADPLPPPAIMEVAEETTSRAATLAGGGSIGGESFAGDGGAKSMDWSETTMSMSSAWQIPVDFKIRKGRFCGELTVLDSYGRLVYRVSGRSSSASPRCVKTLFDSSGNPLLSAVLQDSGWQVFKGNSWEAKDLIFAVNTVVCSPFQTELEITLAGEDSSDPRSIYKLVGNPFRRSCTIYRETSIVAQANLLYKLRKIIYSRDKFRLTVYPEIDHTLAVSMLIVFFGEY